MRQQYPVYLDDLLPVLLHGDARPVAGDPSVHACHHGRDGRLGHVARAGVVHVGAEDDSRSLFSVSFSFVCSVAKKVRGRGGGAEREGGRGRGKGRGHGNRKREGEERKRGDKVKKRTNET